MDTKFHKDLMTLAGHTYNNGNFRLPNNWQELTSFSANNGFQAIVYKNGNNIAISYRGTDTPKDFILSDIPMGTKILLPVQYKNANEVYKQIKQMYPNANITLTGHSLGGSLAQLISAENNCPAVTFNAYGTGDILNHTGYNRKNLNIINYGNPNDVIFKLNYDKQPGRTFLTNTNFNKNENLIWEKSNGLKNVNFMNHLIEQMGPLEDAIEIKPTTTEYNAASPFQLYAEKTFTREEIANMSNEDYLKYEPQILQQLRNGQFKEQKPDYDNFVNPNTGSKKIYTREELSKMSADEFMKNEFEIMGQLQSIGLPDKKDLPQNSTDSDDGRWVTINGNHVFIEK